MIRRLIDAALAALDRIRRRKRLRARDRDALATLQENLMKQKPPKPPKPPHGGPPVQPPIEPPVPPVEPPIPPIEPPIEPPVPPIEPPPSGVLTIALQALTFDGSTRADAVTSNGIELPPGALMPGKTDLVRWFINGVELPIYVEELSGVHADGSLRAIYVQSVCALSPTAVAGECRIGEPRTIGTLPDQGVSRGLPLAAAIPSDVAYLISCDTILPPISKTAQLQQAGDVAQFDTNFFDRPTAAVGLGDFIGYNEYQWANGGDLWTLNYYDRALIWRYAYTKTANPVYWYRFIRQAVRYRDDYLAPGVAVGGVAANQAQLEGVACHYWSTGDLPSKTAVLGQMEFYRTHWEHFEDVTGSGGGNSYSDDRSRARVIQGFLLAWRLDPNGQTGSDPLHDPWPPVRYDTVLKEAPARLLKTQDATGRGFTLGTTQLNYMQGMVGDALTKVWHWFGHGAGIQTYVTQTCAYLDTQWNASLGGFQYANESFNWGPGLAGGTEVLADLNNLMLLVYGFAYQLTGTPSYKKRGDEIFAGALRAVDTASSLQYPKTFNQNYWDSWHYVVQRT